MRRILVACLVTSAFFLAGPPARSSVITTVPPESLAEISPLIVEGTVARTASGYDPVTGSLSTYVTLDVETVHRGPDTLERVVLREPGGSYGSLVHVVEGTPHYTPGERVFVFLEAARDGALRTTGMALGRYQIVAAEGGRSLVASRHLPGRKGRAAGSRDRESVPLRHLASLAASLQRNVRRTRSRAGARGSRRPESGPSETRDPEWLESPPEMDRLLWDDVRVGPGRPDDPRTRLQDGAPSRIDANAPRPGEFLPKFEPLSSTYPARWHENDTGIPISVDIERARDPLGDGAAAVAEMQRAFAAWTDVSESRFTLQTGDDDASFTGSNSSPAQVYPSTNIILFGDPYDDITDPVGCSGTLAIGGYWRTSSPQKTINNEVFYPILKLYVIFNNDFECFLGNSDNLAEVATHELGHGIGLGHSTVSDAIMRASAYGGGRGPRLGDDDVDAAHCHYPHTLTVSSPNGGESWEAGTVHNVLWTATAESGADPGLVDVELSTDGGSNWSVVSSDETNDGVYAWTVDDAPGSLSRIRVIRHNRVSPTPSPFPSACSSDMSNGDFTITAAAAMAGTVPDGGGSPLTVEKGLAGDLDLTWGASCSSDASDYAVYEGTLDQLRAGNWDHASVTCAAGTDLAETITPGAGDRYYLVAPLAGASEGRLGGTSSGTDRPASASACGTREESSCP